MQGATYDKWVALLFCCTISIKSEPAAPANKAKFRPRTIRAILGYISMVTSVPAYLLLVEG